MLPACSKAAFLCAYHILGPVTVCIGDARSQDKPKPRRVTGRKAEAATLVKTTTGLHSRLSPSPIAPNTSLCVDAVIAHELLCVRVCRDIADCVCRRHDLVGLAVRDLNSKLLLKRHDNLHGVQTVQAQVLLEVRCRRDLPASERWSVQPPARLRKGCTLLPGQNQRSLQC